MLSVRERKKLLENSYLLNYNIFKVFINLEISLFLFGIARGTSDVFLLKYFFGIQREVDTLDIFLQACVNGLLMGGFYSLMGMGQNVIFGVMKIVNFCHGEMLMVGMYLTYMLNQVFGMDPYLCVPFVAVIMFALGALIQHTLITPSLGTKSFTNLLFLTVGLGLLLSNGALVIFGSQYRTISTSYARTNISLGMVNIPLPRLISFLVLIVISIALFIFLKKSTTGKQIRAVSQNPVGAEVVGINTKKIYVLTYGIGTALAGIAGSLLTGFYTIYPTAGASFGFRALIVVVVGGLGSIPGAFAYV